MKYLLPLILLTTFAVSCKKKETHKPNVSVSRGDFMILVVSDSVECIMEYKKNPSPSVLHESPATVLAEFQNGDYLVFIYAHGVGAYGTYTQTLNGGWYAVDFPHFVESYPDAFVDSIPGKELYKHSVYHVPLDTSKIDYLLGSTLPEELEFGWSKIQDLRILSEYRKNYPHSRIGFLYVKKVNGESKRYFFMSKYKP